MAVGQWLDVNGEAIYGTHNWIKFGEGGGRGQPGLNIRFTVKGDALYAIILGNWPGEEAVITSLATTNSPAGKIKTVTMLGSKGKLQFTQDDTGLKVKLARHRALQIRLCAENHRPENESADVDRIGKSAIMKSHGRIENSIPNET